MTDLFAKDSSTPARLGIVAQVTDGDLCMNLYPRAEILRCGAVRASIACLMIDLVAGFALDEDPRSWVLTTDISVRMRPLLAPDLVSTRCTILREGGRSATAAVDLVDQNAVRVATGTIGFARVARLETESEKPTWPTDRILSRFDGSNALTRPIRDETCITVLDASSGLVEMPVTPEVRNAAGTLQGAMVALVAEVAAEELISARFGIPAVVTELDVRYLAKTGDGPVYTRCSLLGAAPDSAVQVEIFDRSSDRLTTFAYARAAVIPTEASDRRARGNR